jgi:hypothetical protein
MKSPVITPMWAAARDGPFYSYYYFSSPSLIFLLYFYIPLYLPLSFFFLLFFSFPLNSLFTHS